MKDRKVKQVLFMRYVPVGGQREKVKEDKYGQCMKIEQ
jgi:hypothetical protein